MPSATVPTENRTDQVALVDASYAENIIADIRALRRRVIEAWQERGVGFTREEQVALRVEIADTCSLLSDLTKSG